MNATKKEHKCKHCGCDNDPRCDRKYNGFCFECYNAGVPDLLDEIERLKRGDFTPEEFQALCHKFTDQDACEFAKGCVEYNRKLFGDKMRLMRFKIGGKLEPTRYGEE